MENIKKILGEHLTEEAEKAIEAYASAGGKDYIPRAKYNELNELYKKASEDVKQRDTQLSELGEKAKGNSELQLKIKELQELNSKAQQKYDEELKALRQETQLKDSLMSHNPRNVKALLSLIDRSKIQYTDDGKITGLDEQVEGLKKSDNYLFGFVKQGTGFSSEGKSFEQKTEQEGVQSMVEKIMLGN